jgi:hypothetical protein
LSSERPQASQAKPIPVLDLVRVTVIDEGAFGVLLRAGRPLCLTCERTYENGKVKIPAGEYICRRTVYHRAGYQTFEVTGVQGHSRLLFHIGNTEADSEGCILVGSRFGRLNDKPAVIESARAFADLMWSLYGVPAFTLRVRG